MNHRTLKTIPFLLGWIAHFQLLSGQIAFKAVYRPVVEFFFYGNDFHRPASKTSLYGLLKRFFYGAYFDS